MQPSLKQGKPEISTGPDQKPHARYWAHTACEGGWQPERRHYHISGGVEGHAGRGINHGLFASSGFHVWVRLPTSLQSWYQAQPADVMVNEQADALNTCKDDSKGQSLGSVQATINYHACGFSSACRL